MELFQGLGLKRHSSIQHRIQEDSETPNINEESFITFIDNNFRGEVGRGAALLLNYLSFLDNFADTKVAYFDALLAVKQNVVELDVSVDDRPAMDVCKPVQYLFENELAVGLFQRTSLLDQPQQITATSIFHHHQQMFLTFKNFKQPDHVAVFDLFQEVYFLEDLSLREFVLHVTLLNSLDCHLLSSQLVDTESDFAKSALANELLELVKVKRRWRQFICFIDMTFDVLD